MKSRTDPSFLSRFPLIEKWIEVPHGFHLLQLLQSSSSVKMGFLIRIPPNRSQTISRVQTF